MSETKDRRGVVICGAYGMENTGDDAILRNMLAGLRGIDKNMPITVLARRPKKTAARFGVRVIHPMRPLRWIAAMRTARLVISGGGTLLQDATSLRSLLYYLFVIRMGKHTGCAVQLYGCGIGPLRREWSKTATASVLNTCVDVITVRDEKSLSLMREIGVTKPPMILTADPVFSEIPPAGARERRFGIVLRADRAVTDRMDEILRAIRHVYVTRHLEPVLFCLSPEDRAITKKALEALADIPCVHSTDAGRIGKMSLVLSVRLHGLIFAVRGGVPAVGIAYDPKVSEFCREAGIPCADENGITEKSLCELIETAVHMDAERLYEIAGRSRQREKQNTAAAAQLLMEGGRRS